MARYLRADVPAGPQSGNDIMAALRGRHEPTAAADVFSRFLRHLRYLELPAGTEPLAELHWFPASGAVR